MHCTTGKGAQSGAASVGCTCACACPCPCACAFPCPCASQVDFSVNTRHSVVPSHTHHGATLAAGVPRHASLARPGLLAANFAVVHQAAENLLGGDGGGWAAAYTSAQPALNRTACCQLCDQHTAWASTVDVAPSMRCTCAYLAPAADVGCSGRAGALQQPLLAFSFWKRLGQ